MHFRLCNTVGCRAITPSTVAFVLASVAALHVLLQHCTKSFASLVLLLPQAFELFSDPGLVREAEVSLKEMFLQWDDGAIAGAWKFPIAQPFRRHHRPNATFVSTPADRWRLPCVCSDTMDECQQTAAATLARAQVTRSFVGRACGRCS